MRTEITDGIISEQYQSLKKYFVNKISVDDHVKTYTIASSNLGYADPEFTGKYIDVCMHYYKNEGDKRALENAKKVIDSIIANQRADGYLGCLEKGAELIGFSIWSQGFTILGMLSYAEVTGDKNVVDAALKCGQYIANAFIGDGGADIFEAENGGSEHITVLYSMVKLWKKTNDDIIKSFIDHIINRCENSSMNIISFDNILELMSTKGIEMIVVYLGLLEYGKTFKDEAAIEAVRRYWKQIYDTQIRNTGNGTVNECWCEGGNKPAFLPIEGKPNETCVAVGWIELSLALFWTRQDVEYLSAIEKTFFNHMLASVSAEGDDFAYYQSNYGQKITHTSKNAYKCCRYRGYTLFSCLPELLYYTDKSTIIPTLYVSSEYEDEGVTIKCKSDYPANGHIEFDVNARENKKLCLRIPDFVEKYNVYINGVLEEIYHNDGFVCIEVCGNMKITLEFIYSPIINSVEINGDLYDEVIYGPLLLASDTHYSKDVSVGNEIKKEEADYSIVHFKYKGIALVDYASAGSCDPEKDRYSVWIK